MLSLTPLYTHATQRITMPHSRFSHVILVFMQNNTEINVALQNKL